MTGLIETHDDGDDETANLYRDSGADPLDEDLDEEDDDEEATEAEEDEGEEVEDLDGTDAIMTEVLLHSLHDRGRPESLAR